LNIPHSAPQITNQDFNNLNLVLQSGMIAKGTETFSFEEEFSTFTDFNFVKATTSGTAALIVAFKALGIGPGNEVILPTYVCKSVLHAVYAVGAKGVLCDIGDGWVMNYDSVHPLINQNTKAIVAVHIFGISVKTEDLVSTGVPVIEDCCQSLGFLGDGSLIGAKGDISIYSLHATKCLPAGEGGIIATNRADLGKEIDNISEGNKIYFNLSDISSTLARSQLSKYNQVLERRIQIAEKYFKLLPQECTQPLWDARESSMFFRFPLRWLKNIAETIIWFDSKGIQVRRGVDALLHRLVHLEDDAFPNSVKAYEGTLSIPILPQLSPSQIQYICQQVQANLNPNN